MDWVREIARQIGEASHFLVLLSSESILSDMVREEVRLAHERFREGALSILPVRVALEGQLPYDLGSYLNRIQWDRWNTSEPFQAIAERLAQVIAGNRVAPCQNLLQIMRQEPQTGSTNKPARHCQRRTRAS